MHADPLQGAAMTAGGAKIAVRRAEGGRNARPRVRAYTLVETLVALMVLSLVALGVAAILQAAAYGTSSQREVRRTAVRGELAHGRIDDAIRGARAVLAAGSGYIVLWTGDANTDTHVNLSELELIELPAASTTLTAYVGTYAPGDPVYAAGSDFYTVAQSAKAGVNFPATTWATNISGLTFALDNAAPALARLVTWSLTLTDRQLSRTVAGGAALRAPGQPQ
jgi:type II secretory pathway pseudopilin PulG